jgi:hypothetical protein
VLWETPIRIQPATLCIRATWFRTLQSGTSSQSPTGKTMRHRE